MEIAVITLIILIALLLIISVLIQNSKGGGLASNIGINSNQFGVKKTSDFLEKLTWGLAISLVVLCLGINVMVEKDPITDDVPESVNVEKAQESKGLPSAPPAAAPAQPATKPAAPAAKP
jgi:preprotein translocase subunit SecG